MKVITVALAGLFIQGIGLSAFIVIANGAWASPGKSVVIAITFALMAILLFYANRPYALKRAVAISASLSIGYLIAYHILGAIFSGLLKDLRIPSVEYFQAILPIFGLLFVLYLGASILVGLLNKFFPRSRDAHTS